MYIPNSYEFYWNTSATLFRKKMLEEYNRFWTKERIQKATALNLTPVQVITLASIVHKETAKKLVKNIKDSGIKVQASIMDDQLRVQGKKLDDLQAVISLCRGQDFGQPLQFINMRN